MHFLDGVIHFPIFVDCFLAIAEVLFEHVVDIGGHATEMVVVGGQYPADVVVELVADTYFRIAPSVGLVLPVVDEQFLEGFGIFFKISFHKGMRYVVAPTLERQRLWGYVVTRTRP